MFQRKFRSIVLAALMASGTPVVAMDQPDIVGEARDLDSGQFLYRELYFCNDAGIQCTVLYKDEEGELIARKELDYSASLQAPAFAVEDLRRQRAFNADAEDYGDNYVVDAGFDNFMRLQWDQFTLGEDVRFPLLVAGRDKALQMRASATDDCLESELCLKIRLDNWLLGSLVKPIELTYERDSQRLLRYRGISNLGNGEGRNPRVDIRYQYPDSSSSDALSLNSGT